MAQSTNIGLILTPSSESTMHFLDWRLLMNGDASTSNMQKIDAAIGEVNQTLSDLETALSAI